MYIYTYDYTVYIYFMVFTSRHQHQNQIHNFTNHRYPHYNLGWMSPLAQKQFPFYPHCLGRTSPHAQSHSVFVWAENCTSPSGYGFNLRSILLKRSQLPCKTWTCTRICYLVSYSHYTNIHFPLTLFLAARSHLLSRQTDG